YRRNWARNRGSQVLTRNPEYRGDVPPNYALFFPGWSPLAVNQRYVRRFLELASARGIPVVWMIQPYAPAAQSRRELIAMDARYAALVHRMQAPYPGITVVDARHSGYEPTVFIDAVHLDRQGAATLSEDLAATLRTLLAGDLAAGWTRLRRY